LTTTTQSCSSLKSEVRSALMAEVNHVYRLWSGVDIAAKTFTATWTTDRTTYAPPLTLPYTPEGITTFQQQLSSQGIARADTLIVLEATGSYFFRLAVALQAAGFVISVVNPKQADHWAQSLPRGGKTDALDARMLTQYAWERQQHPCSPAPALYHELRQRLTAREALAGLRQQGRNQADALRQWPVVLAAALQAIEQVIRVFHTQIAELDAAIVQVLRDAAWAASAELMQSIIGIGPLTRAWLLVLTVNFRLCPTAAAAANYAELIRLPHESGTSVRGRARLGHDGNARLRTAL
jgi:transposase